jgi:hypothetical protein
MMGPWREEILVMIRAGSRWALLLASCLQMATSGEAAEREVRLRLLHNVTRDIPAFPRIAEPVDDAERKVNVALDQLDARARSAARDCKPNAKGRGSWERMLSVPVSGPGFLSFYFADNVFCGGAHPNYSTAAIVFDLRSGVAVDWTKILPPVLTGQIALLETSDGSKITTLSSFRLHRLYLDSYRPVSGKADVDAADDECREAVANGRNGKPPRMLVWLKDTQGLAIQFNLEHAMQACADEVVVPIAVLKTEGASADLVRALEAARPAQLTP